jgi:hypothetical protein
MTAVRPDLARQGHVRHDVIQPESILNEQEFRAGPSNRAVPFTFTGRRLSLPDRYNPSKSSKDRPCPSRGWRHGEEDHEVREVFAEAFSESVFGTLAD